MDDCNPCPTPRLARELNLHRCSVFDVPVQALALSIESVTTLANPLDASVRFGQSTTARVCEGCGKDLPLLARPDRRFCDDACRVRAARERDRISDQRLAASDDLQQALLRVQRAELVAYIATQARSQWIAAAWLLERQYPARWGAGRRFDESELAPVLDPDDPFEEVDMLAARRRERLGARGDST